MIIMLTINVHMNISSTLKNALNFFRLEFEFWIPPFIPKSSTHLFIFIIFFGPRPLSKYFNICILSWLIWFGPSYVNMSVFLISFINGFFSWRSTHWTCPNTHWLVFCFLYHLGKGKFLPSRFPLVQSGNGLTFLVTKLTLTSTLWNYPSEAYAYELKNGLR